MSHQTAEVERRRRAAELVAEAAETLAADGRRDRRHARPGRIEEWDDELTGWSTRRPRPVAGDRRTAAIEPVRDRAGPAARRPGRLRRRPGPPDAAAAVAGGPLRHPVPRLGGEPLRPAGADRPRRAAGSRRRRHRRRRRPARADRALRGGPFADRAPYAVEPPFALVLAGQVVRGPDRRGVRRSGARRRRVARRRLEDQPRQTPTRSSSRSTGWPGPSWPACRSSGCGRRSTTCAAAPWSSPSTSPARAELERVFRAD